MIDSPQHHNSNPSSVEPFHNQLSVQDHESSDILPDPCAIILSPKKGAKSKRKIPTPTIL